MNVAAIAKEWGKAGAEAEMNLRSRLPNIHEFLWKSSREEIASERIRFRMFSSFTTTFKKLAQARAKQALADRDAQDNAPNTTQANSRAAGSKKNGSTALNSTSTVASRLFLKPVAQKSNMALSEPMSDVQSQTMNLSKLPNERNRTIQEMPPRKRIYSAK